MKLNNYDMYESIYDRYIENNDFGNVDRIMNNITKLAQNNLACIINYNESVSSPYSIGYRLASKFVQKYNKKNKKSRRSFIKYEFGDDETFWTNIDPKLVEITKYVMDDGTYIAQLDDDNYCILDLTSTDDKEFVTCRTKLCIIGNKWKKWRNKFNKQYGDYRKLAKYNPPDTIITSRGVSETIFKGFDKYVMRNKEQVLRYVDNWIENIPTYHKKYDMIPKLSILLYGDPGTGKSTFYKALAKYLGISTVTIVDKDFLMRDRGRRMAKSIYAIDDIDCMCKSRKNSKSNDNDHILSTLLEFLDNPPVFQYKAKNGVEYPIQIVVATTNYYNKLDPAVKRYGRFDLQFEMKEFDKKMAQEMCDIYDLKLDSVVNNSNDKNFKISPSKLQAICLNNIDLNIKSGLEVHNGLIRIKKRTRSN